MDRLDTTGVPADQQHVSGKIKNIPQSRLTLGDVCILQDTAGNTVHNGDLFHTGGIAQLG